MAGNIAPCLWDNHVGMGPGCGKESPKTGTVPSPALPCFPRSGPFADRNTSFLPPGRQPQVRAPVIKTISVPMIDHNTCIRWRFQQQAVHVNHLTPALRSGIELAPNLMNAPSIRQEQP
jgi:hypothetical protein